jgi:putative resolvase
MNEETTKETKDEFIPTRVAAQLSGLHPNTIRLYADEGKIQSIRSASGQRRISKHSLQAYIDPSFTCQETSTPCKLSFIYTRVSSRKQTDDLHRQVQFLQSKYPSHVVLQDVASGVTFKRKGLQSILDACLQGTIGEVVVAHRDRIARFGYDLIKDIIERSGGTLTVIDDQRNKSTEQELAEDLLSIIHIYSCKQMGKRSYTNRGHKNSESQIEITCER